MRIPRSRGAVSGLLLIVLGAWSALIPFIGPSFDLAIGTEQTWDWSWGRFWLFVLPGAVAIVGGLMLLTSANRAMAGLGAWMGIAAGAWLVVGPTVSRLWTDGAGAAGEPIGGTNRQVVEVLTMQLGPGLLIATLSAFALGRLAVRSVRDAELAREAELEGRRQRAEATGVGADADDDRFRREPVDRGGREPAPGGEPVAVAPARPASTDLPAGDRATSGPPPATSASSSTAPTTAMPAARPPADSSSRRRSGGLLDRLRR